MRNTLKRTGPGVSGARIAQIAEASVGHPYSWGVWDCSGAVNHWLSAAGLAIPGYGPGRFHGPPPHGPVVIQYAGWNGASTVDWPPNPGDLCIWPGISAGGHIGIAVGPDEMVSALDSQSGTVRTPIHGYGPAGVTVMYRRLHAVAPGSGNVLPPSGLAGCGSQAALITGGLIWVMWKLLRK